MNENLLTAVDVPEQTYRFEQTTVAISNVRVGDLRGGRKVANVKVGRLNTELLDADGKRIDYFRNETGVLIERQVADEDVANLRRRLGRHNMLLDTLNSRYAPVERAQEQFNAYLAEYGAVEPGRLANLLEATANQKLWTEMYRIAERVMEPDYSGGYEFRDLVDLVIAYAEQLRDRLLQPFGFRALSRSTGVVHNLVEDVDREAMAKFLDQLRWYADDFGN